ncbi:MAG TPA: M4 family metallopeptidase [Pyrinomonadaceae bacterium]|nr:M4 family metallopeptidase [Pyrinomonadaceae bacterium]
MFNKLRAERAGAPEFALATDMGVANTDPETVARGYLQQSLASEAVPAFTTPQTDDGKSEFKSLGTETLPLTNTKTVKFRQTYNQIPIYSSLVTVELDENNEFLSINSALGTPSGVSPIAKVAPAEALAKALKLAGSKASGELTPRLNYYFDQKANRWRLVYIIEDVPLDKPYTKGSANSLQLAMDFVIDAHSGALVAELPRTPSMAGENEVEAADGLGKKRVIRFKLDSTGKRVLFDDKLNVVTFDFAFRDPQVEVTKLPGKSVTNPPNPWASEAVSAHANAAAVAAFLRDVLKRNNIDNQGGALVSTVNCVVVNGNPLGQKQWLNAFWTPLKRQMVYGQVLHGPKLRSLAVNLDVVGHEMFHGVTNDTARLEYQDESGALNESYSDIFGVLISNFDKPNIADWDWQLGENLTANDKPLRDLSKPSRFNQPEHMKKFVVTTKDFGGVHTNSGIHNFAAFKIMTARDAQQRFIFTPTELAAIFYISLTQHLSRISGFSASRRGVTLAAQTLFRNDPEARRNEKINAISKGFTAVGITEPSN